MTTQKQKKLKVGSVVIAEILSGSSFSGVVSNIYSEGPFNISVEVLKNAPGNYAPYKEGQNYIFCENEIEVLFS